MIKTDDLGHINVMFGFGTVGISAGHERASGKPCLFLHEIAKGEDPQDYVGRNSEEMPSGCIRLQFDGADSAIAVISQILFAFKNSKKVNVAELNHLLKAVTAEAEPLY